MTRLEQALQLRKLAQRLATSDAAIASHPQLVFGALVKLLKARPGLIAALSSGWGDQAIKRLQHPKLTLWRTLARPGQVKHDTTNKLLRDIQETGAWKEIQRVKKQRDERLAAESWNHHARLKKADRLITQLEQKISEHGKIKLFFWHHYDSLGFLPRSWLNVLQFLRRREWVVIVSSSKLNIDSQQQLERAGCIISERKNIGMCLGAYRDFCCLLSEHKHIYGLIQNLVLCNDSTLPVGGDERFCNQVESINSDLRTDTAHMIGMTDSVQTTAYHIQSYFLSINSCLLQKNCWTQFWERFNPYGEKDDLIQRGEIGLSQWLLKRGIQINARYSLASILLSTTYAYPELKELDLRQPKEVNVTLMCWKALLKAGFPLIKKQLLFDPPHFLPRAIPMSELSEHLSDKDEHLSNDLEQLLKSRFLKAC